MKQTAAVILIGLTVFLTTFLGMEYLNSQNEGDVASQGSDKKSVASQGSDKKSEAALDDDAPPAKSSAEPGQKSSTDRTQDGGDGELAGTDTAAKKGNEPVIRAPGRTGPLENTNTFQQQLQKLVESRENSKHLEKNQDLLEQIRAETAKLKKLVKSIENKSTSAKGASNEESNDSTPGTQDESGAGTQDKSGTSTPVGPKTAKIWAERWGKLELKQRTLFVRKLDEVDGVADVVVILQQMKPEQIAETLAQLAKEDEESAAGADKASEGGKQDLAARLVTAMMKAEKDAEKKATE